ncbi:MAG: hypothetical protein ND866_12810 [Pyrinomonadaceae bacterium]|nr:hypothetical protein [Pyrinomonadaceae bacterium]
MPLSVLAITLEIETASFNSVAGGGIVGSASVVGMAVLGFYAYVQDVCTPHIAAQDEGAKIIDTPNAVKAVPATRQQIKTKFFIGRTLLLVRN